MWSVDRCVWPAAVLQQTELPTSWSALETHTHTYMHARVCVRTYNKGKIRPRTGREGPERK